MCFHILLYALKTLDLFLLKHLAQPELASVKASAFFLNGISQQINIIRMSLMWPI
jgi:hypothetical protein